MGWGYYWKPYVPVANRRARARKHLEKLRRKGIDVQPVEIAGRTIASTFWGEAWCNHLEAFSDFANRLPRGRTYVRNGSVCHLAIGKGEVSAIVSGSHIYNVRVSIKTLPTARWNNLKSRCGGQVGSLLELLQGRLSGHVMGIVTDKQDGLFPLPKEMDFECSCPDWAHMCKHVAAVLYGVGARLDERPELLFTLRGVDHSELVCEDAAREVAARRSADARTLDVSAVADVFGIELDQAQAPAGPHPDPQTNGARKTASAKTGGKKKSASAKRTATRKAKVVKVSRKKAAVGKRRGATTPAKQPVKSEPHSPKKGGPYARPRETLGHPGSPGDAGRRDASLP
jgi:uncharacterized Zn finger protein